MFEKWFGKKTEVSKKLNVPENCVVSPFKGKRIDFESIDDFVFSKGLMGKGVAIYPEKGVIYAPVSGEIVVIAPLKHAIGIKTKNGIEVLIHIGYKTELLYGKEFTTYHTVGQSVEAGDKLVTYNYDDMKKRAFDLTTMIIVTNTNDYKDVVPVDSKEIEMGEVIIEVTI